MAGLGEVEGSLDFTVPRGGEAGESWKRMGGGLGSGMLAL